jgi:heterodisulfide reductase subunit A
METMASKKDKQQKNKPQAGGNGAPVGSVMVVGGGVAGIQAALDLANSGYYVYLVEKSPAIGGVMAQLDKTFPTNDCSMCILSPKLVEAGRHLNIKLMTMADVEALEGEAGRFTATVRMAPRYIDMEKCIACGICAEKCPRKVADEFNEGLGKRKAAYVKYPQAVPLKYAIDEANCIYFTKKKKCRACEKFCPAEAVIFDDQPRVEKIEVGSVILAPGFKPFDPKVYDYGYGKYPNVITSTEFERILSASGPFEGHLVRPSDKQAPKKIAWLQCVGSRDMQHGAHGYCSGVCCMYAIKEAVIAKEHAHGDLDTAIFFMDMRTYGKEFDRYYNRAQNESGVRFIRSRVHTIEPAAPGSDDLEIGYVSEDGRLNSEVFGLVVLSVGLEIPKDTLEMAKRLGVTVDSDGFIETSSFAPVATSRPGVFVCGASAGPKDIPYSVMEASAASAASAASLTAARDTLTLKRTYPAEIPVANEDPRIGVFVCHCGINIASVVDVPAVREYAGTLPNVAYVANNLFTCSQDTQQLIREAIKEHRLNRVVVAACTPRTHEPLFQETIREAGLNRYLFELANIRDQDSWVHQAEPEKATDKAKDLVRMAVAKVALLEPIERIQVDLFHEALVIGGGVAGMNAALNLADQGFKTYLVEEKQELGGHALKVKQSWKGEDVGKYVMDLCRRVQDHTKVEVLTGAQVIRSSGFVGNFYTTVQSNGSERELQHGVAILATGAHSLKPEEYLYGQSDRVTCWHELEELFAKQPQRLQEADAVAFIQCVGSRETQRPYCSKICCTASVQQAIEYKTKNPELDVYILYRDLRTYGQREELYRKAREAGVLFIRFALEDKPRVEKAVVDGKEKIKITIKDHILGRPIQLYVDYLNLASAIIPKGQEALAKFFKVPLNEDGFFLEAHMKLRPVDFSTDGVFVCGLVHYPKPIEESIAQAQAAAARAATVLTQQYVEVEPIVSEVNPDLCIGCGLCEASCPFSAIRLTKVVGRGYLAENISASCKGCGICAASCPQQAIDMKHFRDRQIIAAIHAGGAR